MKKVTSGGGWPAIWYTVRKARQAGGLWKMWKAMRSRNACKTCALGMGGQNGGMVNELGRFPEVCKKSLQAMAADMQRPIKPEFWSTYSVEQLKTFTPRELEHCGRLTQPVLFERGQSYFRTVDWSEAMQRVADKLKALTANESFWYLSGRSSNEAAFSLQLLARLYGTNHVNNCSYYCHQASGVGLASSIGSGTATLVLEDVEHADVVFSWTMGITHHTHGVQNVQAITNLALMRGMVGRPHAGLMPIRGHSNVQGIGSVGVTPKLKDAIFERLESKFGIELPTTLGFDTMSCMEAAHQRDLKLGFCLGGNLYGYNPDATFAGEAISRLETLVYLNTTLNTGHTHALADETLILPVVARDEEPQSTTQESMFNFVRLSDGGPSRLAGPRSEVELIADLGERVIGSGGPIDWVSMRDTGHIRQAIAKVVPGFEKLAEIGQTKEEFQIDGRTFHQPRFSTETGRAALHVHRLPDLQGGDQQLRLMTVRSEGQFNTVVYEDEDLYRGQDRRDIILMNPTDLDRFGLIHNQRVNVVSDTGRLDHVLARSFAEIRAGNALMYYPEANILVPRGTDSQSKTPAFKGVVIWIETRNKRTG